VDQLALEIENLFLFLVKTEIHLPPMKSVACRVLEFVSLEIRKSSRLGPIA
jgi:hypothetical protein